MKNLITLIQAKFFEQLEKKNSWGKNEVKNLYQKVSVDVLSEYILREDRHLDTVRRWESGKLDPDKNPQQLPKIPIMTEELQGKTISATYDYDRNVVSVMTSIVPDVEIQKRQNQSINSAHGFTEGSDITDFPTGKAEGYTGNPFIDEI